MPDLAGVIPRRHVRAEADLISIGGRRRNHSRADAALQLRTTLARFRCRKLGAKRLESAERDVVGRALGEWRPMADDHWLLGTVLLRECLAHPASIRRGCRSWRILS
jgi:hypothetical protein